MHHTAGRRSSSGLAVSGVPCLLLCAALAGASVQHVGSAEPHTPLDPRIAPEKITEQEPPPLPEQVLLPLPPDHRIAARSHQVPIDEATWHAAMKALERGVAALRARQDDRSGGWMIEAAAAPTPGADAAPKKPAPVAVAVTALAVKAIAQSGLAADDDESVARGVAYMQRVRTPDGAFEGGVLTNYVTSTVASALASVGDPDRRADLADATRWLQQSQWDQGEGLGPRQDWFGGAGYGNRGRPDLSNTQMMLEALYDAGLSPDEPAFQRAVTFLSRTQNLAETNKASWAGNDGGFVYTPANGGESMASEAAGEGRHGERMPAGTRSLRSYGSMTYAGFKSLLYAGLSPDDVRVRAAFDWIRRHWSFDENPGLGQQGLYYYYHAMARALRVAQQHTIVDRASKPHNWRAELIAALVARQRLDGTWVNSADRWLEGEPTLATAYALLALEEALKPTSFEDPPQDDRPDPPPGRSPRE